MPVDVFFSFFLNSEFGELDVQNTIKKVEKHSLFVFSAPMMIFRNRGLGVQNMTNEVT